jgi:hypothetical protein
MTQNKRILNYLEEAPDHSITSMEAFERFGITRLAARIFELKDSGHNIITINEEGINRYGEAVRYARYRLIISALKENK